MQDVQNVLVIGATGSVGRFVVRQLVDRGVFVRAMTRSPRAKFPEPVEAYVGDITDPQSVAGALDGIDAVVFTHGTNGSAQQHRRVDYGAVHNVLTQAGQPLRIALMTAIGVTDREIFYNRGMQLCDWKRRSERLVRATGWPYTIVRPSWFDFNGPEEHRLVFQQGDRQTSGTPSDGVIAREQIAQVLVDSLFVDDAAYKTLELRAEEGPGQEDLGPLFRDLAADRGDSVDGVEDRDSLPVATEPEDIKRELVTVKGK